jgi:hypothetical protein
MINKLMLKNKGSIKNIFLEINKYLLFKKSRTEMRVTKNGRKTVLELHQKELGEAHSGEEDYESIY